MWPDRVSNPGPPTYESGALPIALRGPRVLCYLRLQNFHHRGKIYKDPQGEAVREVSQHSSP